MNVIRHTRTISDIQETYPSPEGYSFPTVTGMTFCFDGFHHEVWTPYMTYGKVH